MGAALITFLLEWDRKERGKRKERDLVEYAPFENERKRKRIECESVRECERKRAHDWYWDPTR